jgi:two-component system response regulator EvgA
LGVQTTKSILFAENDPNVLYTLQRILEDVGFEVVGVATVADARRSMRRKEFDVVLSEFSLEREGSGLELAQAAKELDPAPIVVLITGDPTIEKLRAALDAAVDHVSFKPLELEEIMAALHRLIARRKDSLSFA